MRLLIPVIVMFLCFSSSFIMAQEDALMHHYKFDGDLKDAKGDAHGEVLKAGGDAAIFIKGHDDTENGAISFPVPPGAWYAVEVGTWSPSQEGVKDEMTIAFWAFWRGSNGDKPQDIINKRDNWKEDDLAWGINQHGFTGHILSVHRPGSPKVYANSTKGLPLEKWTHVAISFDGQKAYFYMDGEPYFDTVYTYGQDFEAMIRIGNSANGGKANKNDNFNGALDDVRFYSRKLTDEEISFIFKGPVSVLPSGTNKIGARLISGPGGHSIQLQGLVGRAAVSVMDLKGQLLLKKEVNSNEIFAVDKLSQGINILKIAHPEGVLEMKLLK